MKRHKATTWFIALRIYGRPYNQVLSFWEMERGEAYSAAAAAAFCSANMRVLAASLSIDSSHARTEQMKEMIVVCLVTSFSLLSHANFINAHTHRTLVWSPSLLSHRSILLSPKLSPSLSVSLSVSLSLSFSPPFLSLTHSLSPSMSVSVCLSVCLCLCLSLSAPLVLLYTVSRRRALNMRPIATCRATLHKHSTAGLFQTAAYNRLDSPTQHDIDFKKRLQRNRSFKDLHHFS